MTWWMPFDRVDYLRRRFGGFRIESDILCSKGMSLCRYFYDLNAKTKMNKLNSTPMIFFLTVLFLVNGHHSFAQSSSRPESATVEKIMEQAVRNLTMRYNLNKDQTQKTQEIMMRRVHKFLRDHENAVWPLIRDLLKTGLGTKPPEDSDDMKRIGRSALPLVELAKDAIERGNEEWRQYLTPDQQRMHDFDLAEMDRNFQQIDRNFQHWAEGKPTKQLFPQPSQHASTPPRPMKPPTGLPKSEPVMFDPFRIFSVYVEDFTNDYELSQGQIDAARSILKEFKTKAMDFKLSNRDELQQIEKDYAVAQKEGDREKLSLVEVKRKAILKPIYRVFSQMVSRLEALLTSEQLQRFATADQPVPTADAEVLSEDINSEQKNKEKRSEPQQPPSKDEDSD